MHASVHALARHHGTYGEHYLSHIIHAPPPSSLRYVVVDGDPANGNRTPLALAVVLSLAKSSLVTLDMRRGSTCPRGCPARDLLCR